MFKYLQCVLTYILLLKLIINSDRGCSLRKRHSGTSSTHTPNTLDNISEEEVCCLITAFA